MRSTSQVPTPGPPRLEREGFWRRPWPLAVDEAGGSMFGVEY